MEKGYLKSKAMATISEKDRYLLKIRVVALSCNDKIKNFVS